MADWMIYLFAALVLIAVLVWQVRAGWRRFRRQRLLARFETPEFVDAILAGQIARGMTREMVEASWGTPADIDETVTKTKVRQLLKYDQTGKNRFAARVSMEDGKVVGWETK